MDYVENDILKFRIHLGCFDKMDSVSLSQVIVTIQPHIAFNHPRLMIERAENRNWTVAAYSFQMRSNATDTTTKRNFPNMMALEVY